MTSIFSYLRQNALLMCLEITHPTLFTNSPFKQCKRPAECQVARRVSAWCHLRAAASRRKVLEKPSSLPEVSYLSGGAWMRTWIVASSLKVIITDTRELGHLCRAELCLALCCFLRASAIKLKGEELQHFPWTQQNASPQGSLPATNNKASLMSSERGLWWPGQQLHTQNVEKHFLSPSSLIMKSLHQQRMSFKPCTLLVSSVNSHLGETPTTDTMRDSLTALHTGSVCKHCPALGDSHRNRSKWFTLSKQRNRFHFPVP